MHKGSKFITALNVFLLPFWLDYAGFSTMTHVCLVGESFPEKIIIQLFVFSCSDLPGGLLRLCCKIDDLQLCLCSISLYRKLSKIESVKATSSSSNPLILLNLGSVFTGNRISVITQRHYLSFIVKRHSFHHSLGATNHWHTVCTWKRKKRNKAWCILPLTQMKFSLLWAINGLKSIKARVSLGNVMAAGIYSQCREYCFHFTLHQSWRRSSKPLLNGSDSHTDSSGFICPGLDIHRWDFCLHSNVLQVNGISLLMLTALKNYIN